MDGVEVVRGQPEELEEAAVRAALRVVLSERAPGAREVPGARWHRPERAEGTAPVGGGWLVNHRRVVSLGRR